MAVGYSSNPLYKKLGIKEGMTMYMLNKPEHFETLLEGAVEVLNIAAKPRQDLDYVHIFTNKLKEFETHLSKLKGYLKKDGMIWVSWYKKSAKKPTELTESIIRDYALSIGLVDVKVCAIDEDWSGLKLVYRLKDR